MREMKKAFEAKNAGVTINLTTGMSKQLAERILNGEACDVFAPSSPAVIDQDLMGKKIADSDRDAASWYAIFSANEMVVITAKGNPLGIKQVTDLVKPGRQVRARHGREGSGDRPHHRVPEAGGASQEGKPELAQTIIDAAVIDPAKPSGVPDDGAGRARGHRQCRHRLLFGGRRRAQRRRCRPLSGQRQHERGDPQRGDRHRHGQEPEGGDRLRGVPAHRRKASASCSTPASRRSRRPILKGAVPAEVKN